MRYLSLFTGIGGIDAGLDAAGMEPVAFVEIDEKCRLVLRKHWPGVPIFTDVKLVNGKSIEKLGTIDLICGGFPCQDISLAGKGVGITGSRSGLWGEFARIIGEIRPRFVLIENVAALRYKGKGLYRVLSDLASLGYDAGWHCIPACAVGAPHQRDRIWIVAYPNQQHDDNRRYGTSQVFRARSFPPEIFESKQTVPNPDSRRFAQGSQPSGRKKGDDPGGSCRCGREGNVAHSSCELCKRGREESATPGLSQFADCSWWETESPVCGVADGFPGRVDRLKQLGNSVVPQIPYLIGKAIMEAEKRCQQQK